MKKVSVIVGGTRGIGKQIYKTLEKRGDYIVLISRRRENNISPDITFDGHLKMIQKKIKKKINNIIFCQRLRELNPNKFKIII